MYKMTAATKKILAKRVKKHGNQGRWRIFRNTSLAPSFYTASPDMVSAESASP